MKLFENADRLQNLSPSQNIFYRAVIENNNDGGKAGKVQVRILGIHSEDTDGVPTANLPWAEVMGTTAQHGGMSGIGISTVPLQGTWVWVFLDGGDWNKPIIVGIITGASTKASGGAFSDPDGVYPKSDRVGKSDVASLSTGDSSGTVIADTKTSNRDSGIPTSDENTWEEPEEQSSKAEYPNNVVQESVSGNIIEMDDTGENGRMHWFHNSGTYWEVVGGGDYTIKVVSDYYHMIDGNTNRVNKGNESHTVQGSSSYKIDGDRTAIVGGSEENTVLGSLTHEVSGSVDESYAGGLTCDSGGSMKLTAGIINLN